MLTIRPATPADHDPIWQIMHAVISAGETYTFDPQTSRADALAYWFQPGSHAFVAEHDGRVVGTYIVRANQPGLGSHVANAAFMVAPAARGLGVGGRCANIPSPKPSGSASCRCNSISSYPPTSPR